VGRGQDARCTIVSRTVSRDCPESARRHRAGGAMARVPDRRRGGVQVEEVAVDRRSEQPDDPTAFAAGGAQGTTAGSRDEAGAMADMGTADMGTADAIGAVRIAPRVLRTVVEEAALRVPGVARMAGMGGNLPQLLGRALPHHGVGLSVRDDMVSVDLYLVVEPSANMLDVGAAVQEAVSAAVEHILGMRTRQINVYIQDVA
jgi:uncharacterized alkaline shock family protein YloU